jgi:hypothetical protein
VSVVFVEFRNEPLMLSVIMLGVIMLSVIMMNVFMLSNIMLSVIALCVFELLSVFHQKKLKTAKSCQNLLLLKNKHFDQDSVAKAFYK